jgi:CHAD domain-containing protein
MADGKWITGLSPRTPLVEAAQIVLPARFLVVLNYLPKAAEAAAKDTEHVHQLRVATRRAAAALRLFGSCLPEKRTKPLRRLLRALRRSAGEARDWDVFVDMMRASTVVADEASAPAREFLLGVAAARRMAAQATLVAVAGQQGPEFQKETRNLIHGAFEWLHEVEASLGEMAKHTITALVREMEERSTPPPSKYEQLHEFRILGKRLRYSMEIFADCFQAPLREQLYPAVEEMQEILGHVTDAHVASERIGAVRDHLKSMCRADWPRYRQAIQRLLKTQQQILPRERKRFLAWLPRWRQLVSDADPRTLMLGK